jgi:LMBR1 domain-containing protein 1
VLALTNCIGYLILIVCGGWGLTALPVQLIKNFIFKPRRVHADEFARQKIAIQNKSERLIEIGRQLQEAQDSGRLKRSQVRVLKDFKEATYRLENDWNILHKSFYQAGGSVILPYISLILGILCGCVSIVWIIHIILYMSVPGYPTDVTFGPISPCLNTVFIGLDRLTSEFPAIGAIFYVGFTFYLLLCVLAGATLMSRVVPFFSVHPMKKNDTMMNSILFNVGLFLIASATVNQFCTQAFSGYARATALDSLFQTSVASLQYIKWYFFSTTYVLLLFAGIGFVMTFVCWRERTKVRFFICAN